MHISEQAEIRYDPWHVTTIIKIVMHILAINAELIIVASNVEIIIDCKWYIYSYI